MLSVYSSVFFFIGSGFREGQPTSSITVRSPWAPRGLSTSKKAHTDKKRALPCTPPLALRRSSTSDGALPFLSSPQPRGYQEKDTIPGENYSEFTGSSSLFLLGSLSSWNVEADRMWWKFSVLLDHPVKPLVNSWPTKPVWNNKCGCCRYKWLNLGVICYIAVETNT